MTTVQNAQESTPAAQDNTVAEAEAASEERRINRRKRKVKTPGEQFVHAEAKQP
jgi:parvulin-like peptidyl-prolyl isomerase